MEGSDGSPPQSLCVIRPEAELFPKSQMEKEDTELTVPFQELTGESVKYLGRTDDGVLALSNYRLFVLKNSINWETSVPLGLIESVQTRDLFHLTINCKDASTVKCSFETAEQCSEWQRRLQLSVGVPEKLDILFAFAFYSWVRYGGPSTITTNGSSGDDITQNVNGTTTTTATDHPPPAYSIWSDYSERLQQAPCSDDDFMREVERLGFDLNGVWRISQANENFKLCPTYPKKLLVPVGITDDTLRKVANFRGSRRLPAVVWRHRKSGAVIARCSQPEVGWLGWRNAQDEELLKALADACAADRGEQKRRGLLSNNASQNLNNSNASTITGDSSPSSPDGSHEEVPMNEVRKVLIVDARSYTSAVTNRARGGGCECIEYYPYAEIEFMNLGNIHAIRKSFHALRQLCASPPDVINWLGLLEKTGWLQHLSGLLTASMTVCHAIEKKGRPVLVHCSDGWDRTPQIVATAQLCLDPYYRTVEGFRILVEREWLSYGHKFSDRVGHGPGSDELNERCPVFLQWLDLVHQIHKQFPCSFEFSMAYLIKLVQHSLSCLFGTFLCNSLKERQENAVLARTFSVWPFLSGPMYRNPLYVAQKDKVLWPAHNVRDLSLWTEVYLGSLGNQNNLDFSSNNGDGLNYGSMIALGKTRSYGDLISAGLMQNEISRRSSDPNMMVDANLTTDSSSENNFTAEREDSPDIIANMIHATTQKLQNLTQELNNEDDGCFTTTEAKQQQQAKILENIDAALDDNYEQTLTNLLQHQQPLNTTNAKTKSTNDFYQPEVCSTTSSLTSQQNHPNELINTEHESCELNALNINSSNSTALASFITSTTTITTTSSKDCATTSNIPSTTNTNLTSTNNVSTINGVLHATTTTNGQADTNKEKALVEQLNGGITLHKTDHMSMDLMQSVDLSDPSSTSSLNGHAATSMAECTESLQNLWHGSVNTSTDTLVPMQNNSRRQSSHSEEAGTTDQVDAVSKSTVDGISSSRMTPVMQESAKVDHKSNGNHPSILPKIHSHSKININSSTLSSNNSETSNSSGSLHNLANLGQKSEDNCSTVSVQNQNSLHLDLATTAKNNDSMMEDSIMILPEHQKLEISISGNFETILNNVANASTQAAYANGSYCTTTTTTPTTSFGGYHSSSSYTGYNGGGSGSSGGGAGTQHSSNSQTTRRRRTLSSHSRREAFPGNIHAKASSTITNGNGGIPNNSRFSIPGVRSLPLTPPGMPERQPIAISCPDGLAHALSEQNIRLQQIVHEHKLREDVLLREIHDMRMALLKKMCPNCNNLPATNDEQVDEYLKSKCRAFAACCGNKKLKTKRYRSHHRHHHHHHQQQQQQHQRHERKLQHCKQKHKTHKIALKKRTEHSQQQQSNEDCSNEEEDDDVQEDASKDCKCHCDYCDGDDDGSGDFDSSLSACSGMENMENDSICSWEAVEDHNSGPSSCASSSIQPNNASSVLWVPDHAVSRCTHCQTEFWLGRRKHHCRSCGRIFCADCSEFWASLPDEKLFSPVRLCEQCYRSVTTRMQQHQRSYMANTETDLLTTSAPVPQTSYNDEEESARDSDEMHNDNSNMLRSFNGHSTVAAPAINI